jgi:hypothetical protein
MEENLKNQLDQFNSAIDSKIEKSNNEVVENVVVKANEIVKSEVSEMATKLNERLDAIEVSNKKAFSAKKRMTFKGALNEAFENGAIESLAKGNSRSASFEIKADMTPLLRILPAKLFRRIEYQDINSIQHVQHTFVNYWRKVQRKATLFVSLKKADTQTEQLQRQKVQH